MSNLPGKITDPHLSAEEPLTFRRCLRFILQALLLAFGCAAIIRIIGILASSAASDVYKRQSIFPYLKRDNKERTL